MFSTIERLPARPATSQSVSPRTLPKFGKKSVQRPGLHVGEAVDAVLSRVLAGHEARPRHADEIVGIDERIGASVPPATMRASVGMIAAGDQVLHERQADAVEPDHGDTRRRRGGLACGQTAPPGAEAVEQAHAA